ncbi:protein-export chaperone SecB [Tenacibaculum aiptasiae]|uniref:protein-export chaperone SecB n=1 Tax=Tenacibaculum aiptasiae TaxID=426481 RepID=UPI00232EAFE5|nr:protein-export chaperone SecB [Tenacibaculum aiptasiae]
MNRAAFSLENYSFDKINIDYSNYSKETSDIDFQPSGEYFPEQGIYELKLVFIALSNKKEFVRIECVAQFEFEDNISGEEIPTYFYRNSIAIIFPYIRSFVSTITLQANINPIILPTLNLSDLTETLRESTKIISKID